MKALGLLKAIWEGLTYESKVRKKIRKVGLKKFLNQ